MIALSEFYLKRIAEPEVGKVYFCAENDTRALVPVMIIDGQYESNGRLSNFWKYQNIHTGELISSYGSFWELVEYENEEE